MGDEESAGFLVLGCVSPGESARELNNVKYAAGLAIQEQVSDEVIHNKVWIDFLVASESNLNEKTKPEITEYSRRTKELYIAYPVETPKITEVARMNNSRDSPCMSNSRSKSRSIASVRTESLRACGLRAAARNSLTHFTGFEKNDKNESDATVEVTPGTTEALPAWSNESRDQGENSTSMSIESGPTKQVTENDRHARNADTAAWQGQSLKNHVAQRARKLLFESDELPVSHLRVWQDKSLTSCKNGSVIQNSDMKSVRQADNGVSSNLLFKLESQNLGRPRSIKHHGHLASGVLSISTDLSYLDSEEPGEDSQANALNMVDRLLRSNATGMSQDTESGKIFVPPVSGPQIVKGAFSLAYKTEIKQVRNQLDVFDWVDSQPDETSDADKVSKGSGLDKHKLRVLKTSNLRKRGSRQNWKGRSTRQSEKKNDVSNGLEAVLNKKNNEHYDQSISSKMKTVKSNMLWRSNDGIRKKLRSASRKTRNSMHYLFLKGSQEDEPKKIYEPHGKTAYEQYENSEVEIMNEKHCRQIHQSKCIGGTATQLNITASPPRDGYEVRGPDFCQSNLHEECNIGSGTQVALDAIQMLSHSVAGLDYDKEREEKEIRQLETCDSASPARKSGRKNLRKRNACQKNRSKSKTNKRTKETRFETAEELVIYSKARCNKRAKWTQGVKTRLQKEGGGGRVTSLSNIKTRSHAEKRDANKGNERNGTPNMHNIESNDISMLVVPRLRRSQRGALHMQQNESRISLVSAGPMVSISSEDSNHSKEKLLHLTRGYATRKCALKEDLHKCSDSNMARNLGPEEHRLSTLSMNEKLDSKLKIAVGFPVELSRQDTSKVSGRNLELFEKKVEEHKSQVYTTFENLDVNEFRKQHGVLRKKRMAHVTSSAARRTTRSSSKSSLIREAEGECDQQTDKFEKERCIQQRLPGNEVTMTGTSLQTRSKRSKIVVANSKSQPHRGDISIELDLCTVYTDRRRKKRDAHSVQVLFSHSLSKDTLKHQEKILAKLGGHIAISAAKCTHFVADAFVRTRNMLEAMAAGKAVVTTLWLESCGQACYFVDEKNYILQDSKKEKELSFSMRLSLAAAEQQPLFKGMKLLLSPNTSPDTKSLQAIVEAAGGQCLGNAFNQDEEEYIVIASEDDLDFCLPLLEKGVKVFSTELILSGIVCHSLDFSRNRLFGNFGKQPRRSRTHSASISKAC